jgi:DNA binding domain, excisionase family
MNGKQRNVKNSMPLSHYPDVLDVLQVSEILHISDKSVYKMLRNGELKHVRIGTAYRIPKLYLENILFNS